MDLYKLQKFSTSNSELFSYNKPGFSKKFHRLSFVRLPYGVMKLSAVSVNEFSQFYQCLFFLQSVYFGSFLGRPTFPVFRFSSPASNQMVFVLILSPVLGLANALLGGSNVVLGCGGWLVTSANERESTPASRLIGGGARTGCIGGRTASMLIGLMKFWFRW